MQIYLVGGAVRDALLGEPVIERDWVVVGASAKTLLAEGFKQVGQEFPVFLHPQSGEEYALARTERKTGPGYTGFEFDAGASITLEEDLLRRDLTINAIAQDGEGRLIDPYNGVADLNARLLRHVSPAFGEDPLRVLRVARFAARFHQFGFTVAPETLALMRTMAASGELEALKRERVWLETSKALMTQRPDVFFEVLRSTNALKVVFPELDRLFGVPQPERWHPEIDTGAHLLLTLKVAAQLSDDLETRFAVLTHDLGKGTTPKEALPKHRGHEQRSVKLIGDFCARFPVPTKLRQLADLVAAHHGSVHRANEMRPGSVFDLVIKLDGIRQPDRLEKILVACEADARGRLGLENSAYPQAATIKLAAKTAAAVQRETIPGIDQLEGAAIGAAIRDAQRLAVTRALTEVQAPP